MIVIKPALQDLSLASHILHSLKPHVDATDGQVFVRSGKLGPTKAIKKR